MNSHIHEWILDVSEGEMTAHCDCDERMDADEIKRRLDLLEKFIQDIGSPVTGNLLGNFFVAKTSSGENVKWSTEYRTVDEIEDENGEKVHYQIDAAGDHTFIMKCDWDGNITYEYR